MVVLVEELERDVACTCRFGLADAGGNSIAVGDGSRNVDLERIRVGVLVNDLDGERTGRLVIIRRRPKSAGVTVTSFVPKSTDFSASVGARSPLTIAQSSSLVVTDS